MFSRDLVHMTRNTKKTVKQNNNYKRLQTANTHAHQREWSHIVHLFNIENVKEYSQLELKSRFYI